MLFCPSCSNILLTETTEDKSFRFYCKTCPYVSKVEEPLEVTMKLKQKEVDDVMGGKEAWDNADAIKIQCAKEGCKGSEAFFM